MVTLADGIEFFGADVDADPLVVQRLDAVLAFQLALPQQEPVAYQGQRSSRFGDEVVADGTFDARLGVLGSHEHVEQVEIEIRSVQRTHSTAETDADPPRSRQEEMHPRQVGLAHGQRRQRIFLAD